MRPLAIFLLALLAIPAVAQKEKREPLTETQIEAIREAGVDPNLRVALYTKYANEHADTIKSLINRGKSRDRVKRVDDELQDFTALMDELGSNLDQYGDRKADLREALKLLNEDCPKWVTILKSLPGEPAFDVARKEAIESGEDLADQANRLLSEQNTYFLTHKDEKNQQRAEPKDPQPPQQ
ncbi:hypothetical protein [Terracidiphilus gabretensis]|uniref:hypothetical protein n=1 Tax=Terracidiphilus gabretensis TaxID=1577687 RepID=UPI00071B9BA0|nr:hypothetical protein [Terracidiphilus gabretensis]